MDCQRKAWVNYHQNECKCLRKVPPKIPTDTVRLMARIIFKLQEGELKTFATLPDGTKVELSYRNLIILVGSAQAQAVIQF